MASSKCQSSCFSCCKQQTTNCPSRIAAVAVKRSQIWWSRSKTKKIKVSLQKSECSATSLIFQGLKTDFAWNGWLSVFIQLCLTQLSMANDVLRGSEGSLFKFKRKKKQKTNPNDDIVKQTHASTQLIPHACFSNTNCCFLINNPRSVFTFIDMRCVFPRL